MKDKSVGMRAMEVGVEGTSVGMSSMGVRGGGYVWNWGYRGVVEGRNGRGRGNGGVIEDGKRKFSLKIIKEVEKNINRQTRSIFSKIFKLTQYVNFF